MVGMDLVAAVAAVLPASARAAAPQAPARAYSGTISAGGLMGFRVGGTFKPKGAKTGLYVKDLYASVEMECENKDDPGTTSSTRDYLEFPKTDRKPIVYDAKSKFLEFGFNAATRVRGHGERPFGSINYGDGRLHIAMVFARNAKSVSAVFDVKADGGAPDEGTLIGTPTRGPCKTHRNTWKGFPGSYF
jgi:hypothetical protein